MLSNNELKTLGIASHEIKNMLSVMNSSYQLISKQHPETGEFRFWNSLGDSINRLIGFMDRTSLYRYSMSCQLEPLNLTDILYALPDEADEHFPEIEKYFDYDIDREEILINADSVRLTMAFNEIIANCYEADTRSDRIRIATVCNDNSHTVTICISCDSTFPAIDCQNGSECETKTTCDSTDAAILCKPFYTTKPDHTGIGLSIVNNVLLLLNGSICFKQNDATSSVIITLPIVKP